MIELSLAALRATGGLPVGLGCKNGRMEWKGDGTKGRRLQGVEERGRDVGVRVMEWELEREGGSTGRNARAKCHGGV